MAKLEAGANDEKPESEGMSKAAAKKAAKKAAAAAKKAEYKAGGMPTKETAPPATATQALGRARALCDALERELEMSTGLSAFESRLKEAGHCIERVRAWNEPTMQRLGGKMGLTGEERARLWQVLKAEQREAKKENEAPARWLRECRKCVGPKMVQYVNDDGTRWDLYTLVKVMQGHLRQAFVGRLGLAEYPAKELLTRLLHAAEGRNQRAHERQPTEAEVVETLGQMKRALEMCSCGDAAAKMADLLAETQRLVDAARDTANWSSAPAPY